MYPLLIYMQIYYYAKTVRADIRFNKHMTYKTPPVAASNPGAT